MAVYRRYEKAGRVRYPRMTRRAARYWVAIPNGTTFTTRELWEMNREAFPDVKYDTVRMFVKEAVKKGQVRVLETRGRQREWCEGMPSVKRWLRMIDTDRVKHIKYHTRSTSSGYLYNLWAFDKWLGGRSYDIVTVERAGAGFEEKKETLEFAGVEDIVTYLNRPFSDKKHVKRIITDYLHDEIHRGKAANTMNTIKSAILSFLNANEFDITVKFAARRRHDKEVAERSMNLGQFLSIIKRMDVMGRALMLCKFQRGLDTTTLVDRFNHEAWDQLVKYFGTEDHKKWNTSKCPAPVTLVRVKTSFKHTGFLDVDAVTALAEYLDEREAVTGRPIRSGEPMFLSRTGTPINVWSVAKRFQVAAKSSGVAKEMSRTAAGARQFNVSPHETRDLLKSTLITCGCRYDVADHVIGHSPKDTYEKQAVLYAEGFREEYSKASSRINVVSNHGNFVEGRGDAETREKITRAEAMIEDLSRHNAELELAIKRHEDYIEATKQRKPRKIPDERPSNAPFDVPDGPADADPDISDNKPAGKQGKEGDGVRVCHVRHHTRAKSCPECGSTARKIWAKPADLS